MADRSARPVRGRPSPALAAWAVLTALFLAHHDVWLWDAPHRLAWAGGLPAGLLYHVAYCAAAALVMVWAVRRFPWSRLDRLDRTEGGGEGAPSPAGTPGPGGAPP